MYVIHVLSTKKKNTVELENLTENWVKTGLNSDRLW